MDISEVTNALNKKSGYLGISGYSDSRDVEQAALRGEENAKLAQEMYNDRVAKFIAQYYIELEGNVDAIVFTAGVGENGTEFREDVISKLAPLGITLNKDMNNKIASYKDIHEGVISSPDSKVAVYVVPTNEEIMIIRDTYNIVNK